MSNDNTGRYDPASPPFRPPWPVEVDLHLHTTASDGTLSPTQLIERIAATSLRIIAVTDHDSTEGLDEAMAAAGQHPQLTIIPGIEFGSEEGESEVHLLGYFIDYRSSVLQESLSRFREQRVESARQTVQKLAALGVPVSWDRVRELAGGAVGRPHIARAMVEEGHVANVPEAFDRYLGSGGAARVPRPKFTPVQALELVHRSGGIGAVAHPRTVKDVKNVVAKLAEAGLAGIEVYAEKYGAEQQGMYRQMAAKYNLVECGGSDFHNFGNENEVTPGTSGPPRETARLLLERARSMHGDNVGFVPGRPL
ncbi:MAG: PHP domain-containing protein [Dehalococcoidia bacterium]